LKKIKQDDPDSRFEDYWHFFAFLPIAQKDLLRMLPYQKYFGFAPGNVIGIILSFIDLISRAIYNYEKHILIK